LLNSKYLTGRSELPGVRCPERGQERLCQVRGDRAPEGHQPLPSWRAAGDAALPTARFTGPGSTSRLSPLLTLPLVTLLPTVRDEPEPGAFSKGSRSLQTECETRQETGVRHGQTSSFKTKKTAAKTSSKMMMATVGPKVYKMYALNL